MIAYTGAPHLPAADPGQGTGAVSVLAGSLQASIPALDTAAPYRKLSLLYHAKQDHCSRMGTPIQSDDIQAIRVPP